MTRVSPTIADVSRAVVELDEFATGHPEKTIDEMRRRVAENILTQFERAGMFYVSRNNIMAIMVSHGAGPFTVQQHASVIASMIEDQR